MLYHGFFRTFCKKSRFLFFLRVSFYSRELRNLCVYVVDAGIWNMASHLHVLRHRLLLLLLILYSQNANRFYQREISCWFKNVDCDIRVRSTKEYKGWAVNHGLRFRKRKISASISLTIQIRSDAKHSATITIFLSWETFVEPHQSTIQSYRTSNVPRRTIETFPRGTLSSLCLHCISTREGY